MTASRMVDPARLLGVSTRRVDKLVQTLGITSLSKSQVCRMAVDLDEQVTAFRTRPLTEAGPHVRGRGRADDEGPREGPGGQRGGAGRHRGEHRWTPLGAARGSETHDEF